MRRALGARAARVVRLVVAAAALAGCAGVATDAGKGGNDNGGSSGEAGRSGASGGGGGAYSPGSGGSSSSGSSGSSGGAGASSDAGSAGSPSYDGGAPTDAGSDGGPVVPPCTVAILPVNTPSLVNVPIGAGVKLLLRAEATGPQAPPKPDWRWFVRHDGRDVTNDANVDATDPARVAVPTETPGDYLVTAVAAPGCQLSTVITAQPIADRTQMLLVRVLPPASSGLPTFEKPDVLVRANQPAIVSLALEAGTTNTIAPTATQQGVPDVHLPSYIRLAATSSSVFVEGDATNAPLRVQLNPTYAYSVLIVPYDLAYAPLLAPPRTPAGIPRDYPMTSGITLTGSITDASAAPVAGVRVGMRSGGLPSTVGTSTADGQFVVRARPGQWSLAMVPGAGSKLPEVDFDGPINLALPDPTSARASLQLHAVATVDATFNVSTSNGALPVTNATVRLESLPDQLADAATLTLTTSGGAPLGAFSGHGVVRTEAVTDGAGAATFAGLPRARYRLTIFPSLQDADGVTSSDVDLTTGAATRDVRLSPRVKLSGNVGARAAGARIVAYDDAAPIGRAPASARVAADGAFTLYLDPQRPVRIVVEPTTPGLPLTPFGTFDPDAIAPTWPGRMVPDTVGFNGTVTVANSAGKLVAGAIVQVFCYGKAPDCVDASIRSTAGVVPLVQGVTDARGAFDMRVPNPASP